MSSSADISPRAKVTYDQDNFIVEFSVQDYTPEVEIISLIILINIKIIVIIVDNY